MSEREQLLMQITELEKKEELSRSERKRRARLQHKLELLDRQKEQERILYEKDVFFMKKAIKQAKKAAGINEVPIGCVIVKDGEVVAKGYNRRNTDHSTLSHAEITAIRRASKKLKDWRLEDCTLYVTLEPCQMCAGAIVQARIIRVVFVSMNPKDGCSGSVLNILQMKEFNHLV